MVPALLPQVTTSDQLFPHSSSPPHKRMTRIYFDLKKRLSCRASPPAMRLFLRYLPPRKQVTSIILAQTMIGVSLASSPIPPMHPSPLSTEIKVSVRLLYLNRSPNQSQTSVNIGRFVFSLKFKSSMISVMERPNDGWK